MKNNILIGWRPFGAVLLMLVLEMGTTTALATQIQGFNDPRFYNIGTTQVVVGGSDIFVFNPLPGVDEHLSVTGGRWLAAFIVNVPGVGDAVVGYADNDNDSGMGIDWLVGSYSNVLDTYGDDGAVQKMWLVHDVLGDGIGNVVGSVWFNGSDDVVYTEQDILFGTNRVRGDISQLPHYVFGPPQFLPKMVVNPIPEPATIAVLALGGLLLRKRSK